MGAVLMKATADLRRRRLQAAVVAVVVLLSTLAGTMAVSLLVESDAPYDHAFARQNGAHLVVRFDSQKASDAQLLATAALPTMLAVGGPWREAPPVALAATGGPGFPLRLLGRADPGGPVDRLQVTAGRWARGPGELVLAERAARQMHHAVGDTIAISPGQGAEALVVVGIAASLGAPFDGWLTPAQAAQLHVPGDSDLQRLVTTGTYMSYRLRAAATRADIDRAARELSAAVPAGAILETSDWLNQKRRADTTTAVMIPFLLAFSAFALVAAAMIIGNVVSGAVIAGYREIGIMKSVGFTPAQVVAVLGLQMLAPAVLGALAGLAGGTVASQPFLADTAASFDLPQGPAVEPWVLVVCLTAVLAVVVVATLLPAVRAARLSAAEAIVLGSAPRGGGGRRTGHLLARLPIARPISLGISDAVARPVRSGMTLLAVSIGVATIAFALGLTRSLDLVKHALTHDRTVQVTVFRGDPGGPGGKAGGGGLSDTQLVDLLRAQPGTAHFAAEGQLQAHVDGVGQQVQVYGYRGDAAWIGYSTLRGRWIQGPGEVVAPQALLDAAHVAVGDSIVVSLDGRQQALQVVGAIFDQQGDNLLLRTDWSTLVALSPGLEPSLYEVSTTGVEVPMYARALQVAAAPQPLAVSTSADRGLDTAFLLIEGVLAGLALVLTLIALAGVLNTVVLTTSEKARETAILRSLGMSPGQVVTMILTSVAVIGVGGAAAGIPIGTALHQQILTVMSDIATAAPVPAAFYDVFPVAVIAALGATGVGVALLGAWLPAAWASRASISHLLAAE